MNSRIPPSRTLKGIHEMSEDELKAELEARRAEASNALWRIGTWFPDYPQATLEKLKGYHAELLKFNAKLNLISKNTERDADETHFADCMMGGEILRSMDLGPKVYDFGAGNGFPGIVLAIMDSARVYELVESDSRKCEFMKHVTSTLQLKNVILNNSRLESLKAEDISVAICRGFASISKTLIACNRMFNKDGRIYHFKGSNWSSEVAELPSQLISSWKPELLGEYSLPVTQARRAILCTIKR